MRWKTLAIGVQLWGLAVVSQATDIPERIAMETGALQEFRLTYSAGDVAINPASICDFQVLGKDRNILLLIAGQPGEAVMSSVANLRVWDQEGALKEKSNITVSRSGWSDRTGELLKALKSIPGLKDPAVSGVGETLWAKGTATTVEAYLRSQTICQACEKVVFDIHASQELMQGVQKGVEESFRERGVSSKVKPVVVVEKIVLEGSAGSASELSLAEKIAKDAWPVVESRLAVSSKPSQDKPTVFVRTKIMEVSESNLDEIGLDWATPIDLSAGGGVAREGSGPLQTQSFFSAAGSLTSDLIHLDKTRGDVRLLAEPAVSVESGGQARFVAGGEFPVLIANDEGGDKVEWKEYGLILGVIPVADVGSKEIAMDLTLEWSVLDWGNAIVNRRTRIPAILKKTVGDRVVVKDGEAIVLAGLMSDVKAKELKGVQGLSSVPILGELFKSRDFRKGRTRLVMIVQPTVKDPLTLPDDQFMEVGKPGIRRSDPVKQPL